MDYGRLFSRAWQLVKSYRALWIFGAILALTTISFESMVFYSLDGNQGENRQGITITTRSDENFYQALRRTWREAMDELDRDVDRANQELEEFFAQELDLRVESDLLAIATVLAGVLLTGYAIAKIAGYVSRTALMQMVDETEETGVQHSARYGWRVGWSWTTWRLVLIDLLVDGVAVLAVILLFALVLAPLALWTTGSAAAGVAGTIFTVGLFFPSLVLVIVVGVTLAVFKQFFHRACALEGLGVIASIRRGYAVARQHLSQVLPVWLVTLGVKLAWPLVVAPIVVLLALVGLALGGAGALLLGALASLAFDGATPWLVAGAVGISLFVLTLALPLAFLGGLREVFLSSTWTLTYRELRALESVEPEVSPGFDAPGLGTAPVV